ncbi:MAG: restriction endonuclease subunit S [Oscillospiraceae bacterium]|nr:restriction endonuclease subunit S [Oscillospiraceae bacterium]
MIISFTPAYGGGERRNFNYFETRPKIRIENTLVKEGRGRMKLGEVCGSISVTFRRQLEKVILINTSDVLDGKVINHAYVPNENLRGQFKKSFQQGDILYSEIRPKNRRFAFVDFDASDYVASSKLMVIRANERVLPEFLFQVLKSDDITDQLQLLAETRSGTFPQITFSELAALDVRIPSINDQRAIAKTLGALDDKIENNRKINHHLEQMAQTIFTELCSDGETAVLSDILDVLYGKDHKRLGQGRIPCYGSGGIMRYVNEALYSGESVLIPRKGTLNNVLYINEPFWTVDTMFYTHMTRPNVAKFVYFTVRALDLAGMNVGSAVPSMTTAVLNALEIVLPSDESLASFEEAVNPMFLQIQANNTESARLSELRDTLLPRLMSGELSARDLGDSK